MINFSIYKMKYFISIIKFRIQLREFMLIMALKNGIYFKVKQWLILKCRIFILSIKYIPYFHSLLIGRMKENFAPFPSSLFSAHIFPPWASTMLLQIYRPRPVPWKDFDANFVNSLGKISESIPWPLSLTVIIIPWLALLLSLL